MDQTILDTRGWGFAIGSRDGRSFEGMNPEFARMHGYSVEELSGLSIVDVFAPSSRPLLAVAIDRARAAGRYAFEADHIRRDGTVFPVAIDVTAVKDDAGEVLYRVVFVQDLSERAQRERARQEAMLTRDVLDRLHEGCQVIGFDWRYLYVNAAVASQGRSTPEELVGRTMMECYPGIEGTPMFAVLERTMRERTPGHFENVFAFPDGTQSRFELRFVPVPQGVCILSVDITERRHRLTAIVNDSDDAIIGQTLDGVVTSWNAAAERMFGYTADEMVGRSISALSPATARGVESALWARVAQGERIAHFETTRICKDGRSIDVSVTQSPVRDATGVIVGLSKIARDITETRRIQQELVRAKEATEAANRELESFSYSVAHDLRAPLRSIDGFSQALLEDYGEKLDADGKKYLRFVRESAQLMAQLIDDLLKLAQVSRSALASEPVDLSALARSTCDRLARGAPAREVEVVIEEGLVGRGDARLLAVVFDNLLGNAWKFTGRCERAHIEVGARSEGGELAYFVRDNGAGFDPAYAHKLFGVFQRLHGVREFEGTGIGLATVQRIIHRHGGRVRAEGLVDQGATLWFTLEGGSSK